MIVTWKRLLLILAALGAGGMLFAWSGLFLISASSGHWAISDWFLHWTMRNSVRTYALLVEEQPIDDPALLYPAAGHYASGCAGCHGAPGEPRSPVVREMTPEPPSLEGRIDEWTDAQLFWIVKHGVKFTGMPAWPARGRDDEIWAMTAFLRALPGMDEDRYRDLAFGDVEGSPALTDSSRTFDAALADCARCHETSGAGRSSEIPVIAGQSEAYLAASLQAYAEGARHSGVMQKAAGDAEPELWAELAAHFARQPPVSGDASALDGADLERGREIAERGLPEAGVPACLSCHDGDDRNPVFPLLDGQHAGYLQRQLALFAEEKRGGTAYGHLMRTVAGQMSEDDMRDAAAYFASRTSQSSIRVGAEDGNGPVADP